MTEAARFANRSERSPQPRPAWMADAIAYLRTEHPQTVAAIVEDAVAESQHSLERSVRRGGLDRSELLEAIERIRKSKSRRGLYQQGWVDALTAAADELASPQPSIEPERDR